jgi:5'-nucleotidase
VNRGANAGRAVLHSGTVGAALTAAAAGIPGLAVSLDVLTAIAATAASGGAAVRTVNEADDAPRNWATAARLGVGLMSALTAGVVINVNAPDVPFDRLPGIRRATLARFGQVQMTFVEAGEGFVRTSVEASAEEFEPGTDLAVLADGYASVTAIRGLAELSDVELPGLS